MQSYWVQSFYLEQTYKNFKYMKDPSVMINDHLQQLAEAKEPVKYLTCNGGS